MSKKKKGITCILVGGIPLLGWVLLTTNIIELLVIAVALAITVGLCALVGYGVGLLLE